MTCPYCCRDVPLQGAWMTPVYEGKYVKYAITTCAREDCRMQALDDAGLVSGREKSYTVN